MKTMMKFLAVLAMLMVTFSPQPAVAADDIYKFKGRGADAYFSTVSADGCLYTSVWVFMAEQVIHEVPANRNAAARVFVSLYQHDYCTEIGINADGQAALSKSDWRIAGSLDSAVLSKTITLHDWSSNAYFDVFVELTWTAGSALGHENSHYIYSFEGYHINQQIKSDFRWSQASGTVSDGTTNFTPEDSGGFGHIFSSKSGQFSHGYE